MFRQFLKISWFTLFIKYVYFIYAISLVPKKFASRIKRLQVLKQAVQLGYIDEQQSQVDRRRRIYFPSETLLKDFVEYANDSDKAVKIDKAS